MKPKKTKKAAPGKSSSSKSVLKSKSESKTAPARRPRKTAAVAKTQSRKPVSIPPILFEGDHPAPAAVTGPGERYTLGHGAETLTASMLEAAVDLPESYGTGKLFLTARDPRWLYASWDLTNEELQRLNSQSRDGHLVLKTYVNEISGAPLVETHLHPESRSWFIHVGRGGTRYMAELGFRPHKGGWQQVATSLSTLTPSDTVSEETAVQFATIPAEVPFQKIIEAVKEVIVEKEPPVEQPVAAPPTLTVPKPPPIQETRAREEVPPPVTPHRAEPPKPREEPPASAAVPIIKAIEQLRATKHPELPPIAPPPATEWTPAQEKALERLISLDSERRVWIGSLEVTELVRRHLHEEIGSISAAQVSRPQQPAAPVSALPTQEISSPSGVTKKEEGKGFWFNVNVELVIYGSTEPDAKVTIGGKAIRLRHDGSFTLRFALPDGEYDLPAIAVSADGSDQRAAHLKFSRQTDFRGNVGLHPQDPTLKRPVPDEINGP